MSSETRVALISGIPGSGKTTLARALASKSDLGVHIEADAFLGFLAHPVDPYSLDSRNQAQAIATAVASSAGAFAAHGYDVFVDGVIGPWHLAAFDITLGSYDYAILDVEPATAIERMRMRGDEQLEQEGASLLWRFFHEYPDILSRHTIRAARSHEVVEGEFVQRCEAHDLVRQA